MIKCTKGCDTMTEKERMNKGLLYIPDDKEIMEFQLKCLDKLFEYNHTKPSDLKKREELIKEMCGSVGENCYFEVPIYSNFGLKHVHFGNHIYTNFNCTFVDDADIYVGNDCMFAPSVIVATAAHPINPHLRQIGYQYNREVHIGNNVWIGAGAIIMPGVTIGDNSVIGAGSIVTKDIESNSVAYGNPCKVQRKIGSKDELYYYRNELIDYDNMNIK